jgi:C1A family cysteine protease
VNKQQHPVNGKMRHLHGWRKDRPDHRDQPFRYDHMVLKTGTPVTLPVKVDLENICTEVVDQGSIGSCTAHSTSYHAETLYKKLGRPVVQLSRLFPYYMTRVLLEGIQPNDDSGCQIRDVMKAWAQFGDCEERYWDYSNPEHRYAIEPSPEAKANAMEHQILTYISLTSLYDLRHCLSEGYTFVGGFSVPQNTMSDYCARTGVVTFPGAHEGYVGGHAIHFVGYDDAAQLLKFQNSWGPDWGQRGFGFLPYAFVTHGLADDFWTIRTQEMP